MKYEGNFGTDKAALHLTLKMAYSNPSFADEAIIARPEKCSEIVGHPVDQTEPAYMKSHVFRAWSLVGKQRNNGIYETDQHGHKLIKLKGLKLNGEEGIFVKCFCLTEEIGEKVH